MSTVGLRLLMAVEAAEPAGGVVGIDQMGTVGLRRHGLSVCGALASSGVRGNWPDEYGGIATVGELGSDFMASLICRWELTR
jgi:hypothetical protein